ncbi:hypothetical protein [Nocardia coubleae]|uniref:Phenylacetate-coenzyme A ligase PaaK-like adenylate-forming protein n=1 Tax=Nocardia coubleae TaxID=356147 RepID=A0A846WE22_9NOCA|nr:hypothetical protein [Nocardia coubleae]NKX90884.1 hypothetical protein [Nocardia coubleae]
MTATPVTTTADLRTFAEDAATYFDRSRIAMHTMDPTELTALQLDALRLRFDELRPRIPVLDALATEQHIDGIDTVDDAAPLLFPHTVYKAYPTRLLVENRFDRMNTWMSRLTTVDLTGLDVSGCTSIDDWLATMDERTELRLAHSSGTTGTMSFIPHSQIQYDRLYRIVRMDVLPDDDHTGVDVVWPSFRTGRSGIARHATAMAEQIALTPDRMHCLHPGLLSADVMFLAGRLRAAAARGEAGRVEVPPALALRRAEFTEALRATGPGMTAFVRRLADELAGSRVAALSTWDVLSGMADSATEQGLTGVFAPDSVIFAGGGSKAGALPDDWAERTARFAGVPALRFVYAMVEVMSLNLQCGAGGYHLEPWLVLYLLDPDTGAVLPRTGTRTGRVALYDLTADLNWGGIVTGDLVTVDWEPCVCGRTTPRIGAAISRFAGPGGDDKITCAATAEALDEALAFLNGEL